MSDQLAAYRARAAGTNIDPASLLSTDYFNAFNEAVMLLDMLPDAPELLEEICGWRYLDYPGHFRASGLDYADLAVAAYDHAPADIRTAFERKNMAIRSVIEETARLLLRLRDAGETEAFTTVARNAAQLCRGLIAEGSAIIHGRASSLDQSAVDSLF